MLKKKFIIGTLILLVIIAFLEYYDVRGVEELSYVIAIGIDVSEENENNIILTVQVATTKPQESGGTSSLETNLLSVETDSIGLGFNILNTLSTNELNLSHCSAIVFSEKLAKKGIEPHFDNLANNIEIRPTATIIVANNTAQEFLVSTSESEDISADFYNSFIESSETTSYIPDASLSSFYSALHDDVIQPSCVYGFSDGSNIENIGLAAFKGDKYIGRLSGIQTIIHNILTNKLDSATLSLLSPIDNKSIINIKLSLAKNTDINISYNESTKIPNIECSINLEGKILSAATNYAFNNSDDLNRLKMAINNKIAYETNNYLKKISYEYNSDIVGFFGYLKRHFLTYDELKNIKWDESFKNATFNINSNIELTSNYLFPRI